MKPDNPKAPQGHTLSMPPVQVPKTPAQLPGRLLVVGVILSATLLGVSIWLSIRAEEAVPTNRSAAPLLTDQHQ